MATVGAMAAVAVALTFVVASWFIVHPEAFVSPGPTLRPVSVGCSPMTCSSIVRRSSVPYVGHPNSCGKCLIIWLCRVHSLMLSLILSPKV